MLAPVALMLVLLPIQIEDGLLLALTTGRALTVTVALELLLHPCELVPVTVYVVVAVGETVTELPVKLPGIQL